MCRFVSTWFNVCSNCLALIKAEDAENSLILITPYVCPCCHKTGTMNRTVFKVEETDE